MNSFLKYAVSSLYPLIDNGFKIRQPESDRNKGSILELKKNDCYIVIDEDKENKCINIKLSKGLSLDNDILIINYGRITKIVGLKIDENLPEQLIYRDQTIKNKSSYYQLINEKFEVVFKILDSALKQI